MSVKVSGDIRILSQNVQITVPGGAFVGSFSGDKDDAVEVRIFYGQNIEVMTDISVNDFSVADRRKRGPITSHFSEAILLRKIVSPSSRNTRTWLAAKGYVSRKEVALIYIEINASLEVGTSIETAIYISSRRSLILASEGFSLAFL